jgi:uncharacterized 2Fe-2S/4Fe-4S cluster protein (DUF4445 family)
LRFKSEFFQWTHNKIIDGERTLMSKRIQIDLEPIGRRITCDPGSTVLEAAQQAGVMLAAICGGQGSCGRCVVQVLTGEASPPTPLEQAQLAPDELASGLRLACQTTISSAAKIHIPPESLAAAQRTQVESQAITTQLEPAITVQDVQLPPPTLDDLRADSTRLSEAIRPTTKTPSSQAINDKPSWRLGDLMVDTVVLQQLSDNLRAWDWQARAMLRGREVIAVRPSGRRALGLAVDIGTTKLAAYLLDLETGQTLGAAGAMNPQIAYGEDVMARIAYVMGEAGGERQEARGKILQEAVVGAVNELAGSLCAQAGAEAGDIADAVVVGNTAMHHLFAGLPVSQLGVAPFVAAVSDALDIKARELGLRLAPGAYVHLLPNIAGFVGADHVAMLLASGLGIFHRKGAKNAKTIKGDSCESDAYAVLGLDIGTNTEICLRAGGKLWACSTASGPAFEGAHIQHGMRAAPGAIERVAIDGDTLHLGTVDDAPPVGLCGSGIVDLIAQLRRAGILNERGAFAAHPRVRRDKFIVASGQREITLSRADISEIQLAKAAIRAGMRILLRQAGLTEADVEHVIIAGAFGTYLDVQSGIDIGLFPPLPRHCFTQVGNAAGAGARMALQSVRERERAANIARQVEYVELTAVPEFQREFAGALRL